jgi:bacitracin transport system permease protein
LITPFNTQKQTWVIYTSNSEDIMFMLVGIIVFILLSSYIFLREYSDNTLKVLYSYPVSKTSIFISKVLTIYILIALIYLLHFIIVFGSGLLVIHESLTKVFFYKHMLAYISSMIFQFSLVPLLIFLINIFKNTTASAMISVFALFSNFYMYEIGRYNYWPFILPYIPIMNLSRAIDIISTMNLSIGVFITGTLLCIFQLTRVKDV